MKAAVVSIALFSAINCAAATECFNMTPEACAKDAAVTEKFLNDMGKHCVHIYALMHVPNADGFTVVHCENLPRSKMYEINGPGACTDGVCEIRLVDFNTMRVDLLYAEQEAQARIVCQGDPVCAHGLSQ